MCLLHLCRILMIKFVSGKNLIFCLYAFTDQPTYGDMDMETHWNCGVCSVGGDILRSQEKCPLKSGLYDS